jgi:tetratricopeptide (TPR) repeat protein
MAQDEDLQKEIEQLKKQTEKLTAEKAKIEAQKALEEAQKALDQAKQASDPELARLQNQKALADAQKAFADAQKALADSQKAADQARSGASQQLADLVSQKALADAQKALADSQKALEQAKSGSSQQLVDLQNQKALVDAQKALLDSQTQAALSKYIGEVKAGPYSGSVDMKEKAGTEEAALLGARAVKEAAGIVAKAVKDKGQKFYVFAAREFPNFQRLLTFRFRKELIKQAFAAAGVRPPAGPGPEAVPITPGLVSAGLDAFSKILGFFKTDFTVGGNELKLDESLLLFSVAGGLAPKEAHLPMIYEPTAQNNSVTALTTELGELVALRTLASGEATKARDKIAEKEKEAAGTADVPTKEALLKEVASAKARMDQLNGVIGLYDSFASALTTADSSGAVPLTFLAQEFAIDKALKAGGHVLLLRLESSGGGYLLKKNLLTGLGRMPLFHMGGATITYVLIAGDQGTVLAGDVVPVHGGFVRSDKIREELEKSRSAQSAAAAQGR